MLLFLLVHGSYTEVNWGIQVAKFGDRPTLFSRYSGIEGL